MKEEGRPEALGARSEEGGKPAEDGKGQLDQVRKSEHPVNEPGFLRAHDADVLDDAGRNANKGVEGLSSAEEDMVKMALGRSEEEKTEDDWVQLVRQQSDLLEAF